MKKAYEESKLPKQVVEKQLKPLNELEMKDLLKHEAYCESEESVNNKIKFHDSDKLLSGKTTGVCKRC